MKKVSNSVVAASGSMDELVAESIEANKVLVF